MPTIEIQTDILRAAIICASTEQARYYLNGVYVDPAGYVVTTDGHRLFCCEIDLEGSNVAPGSFAGWIIPSDAIKRALQGYKALTILIAPDRVGDTMCKPVDGSFPAWRRMVPAADTLSGVTAQFNPAYVADMGKIGALLSPKARKGYSAGTGLTAHLHHNGEGPAGVTFPQSNENAFAVLMPIRGGYHDTAAAWAERTTLRNTPEPDATATAAA